MTVRLVRRCAPRSCLSPSVGSTPAGLTPAHKLPLPSWRWEEQKAGAFPVPSRAAQMPAPRLCQPVPSHPSLASVADKASWDNIDVAKPISWDQAGHQPSWEPEGPISGPSSAWEEACPRPQVKGRQGWLWNPFSQGRRLQGPCPASMRHHGGWEASPKECWGRRGN